MKNIFIYYQLNQERIHRLFKEGGWIFFGQILSVTGGLLLVRVLTEYLSPDQYGQLTLGLTLASLVNQVIMGGIVAGATRYYVFAVETKDLTDYLYATRNLLIYATTIVAIIGLMSLVAMKLFGYTYLIGLVFGVLLYAILNGYIGVLGGIQNAARQRAVVALHSGLDAWLKIPVVIVALLWFGVSSSIVVAGYVFSLLIIIASQFIFFRQKIAHFSRPKRDHQEWISKIWDYSFPFSVWGAFTWMQMISDKWALKFFGSLSDVGQYAVLFQLGYTPIALITGLAVSFLGPILFQRSGSTGDKDGIASVRRITWQITYFALLCTFLGFIITLGIHNWLFRHLVASEYRASSYLLPWIVLAGGIFAAGQMLALKLMSDMNPASMTAAKIVTALIGIFLNIAGAMLFGVKGIIIAVNIFSSIYFIWMAALANHSDIRI